MLLPALAAIFYFVTVRRIGYGIPCVFHRITGYRCPGCGMTSVCTALLCFDLPAAFRANRFVFVTLPFLVAEVLYLWFLARRKRKSPQWNEALLFCYIALLLGWGVLRNIMEI